jgi:hypothetical protein
MRKWRRRWHPPTSVQQNKLCHYVRFYYPTAQLNFPIPIVGKRKKRWADVAIVEMRVAIEYDGLKHHFSLEARKRDKVRDAELRMMGWRVSHVNKFNWKFFMAHMRDIVEGRMALPAGEEGAP